MLDPNNCWKNPDSITLSQNWGLKTNVIDEAEGLVFHFGCFKRLTIFFVANYEPVTDCHSAYQIKRQCSGDNIGYQ